MPKEFTTPFDKEWDFRWTLDRYHLAIENAVLTKKHKVELISGRIWEKYPSSTRAEGDHEYQWPLAHFQLATSSGTLTEKDNLELLSGRIARRSERQMFEEVSIHFLSHFFSYQLGDKYIYQKNYPVPLTASNSEPRPDFVVRFKDDHISDLPSKVCLIVEVADTFLAKDRTIKKELYAEAGIPEYWIVNLRNRQIEIYHKPIPAQKTYGAYTIFQEEEKLSSPLAGEVHALPNRRMAKTSLCKLPRRSRHSPALCPLRNRTGFLGRQVLPEFGRVYVY